MPELNSKYYEALNKTIGVNECCSENGRYGHRLIVRIDRPGKRPYYLANAHPHSSEISPITLAYRFMEQLEAYP